jgi:hypothetical protein
MSEQPGFGPFDQEFSKLPDTEFGGHEGWMQPISNGHFPTASEQNSMIVRTSGTSNIDPVTGLEQPYNQ